MRSNITLTISGICMGLIIILHRLKSNRDSAKKSVSSDLDWISDETIPSKSPMPLSELSVAEEVSNNELHRGLAVLGMVATCPREARLAKDPQRRGSIPHPATGNEEVADDVIRIQRVSEEEEMARYFSAFTSYRN